MDVSLPLGGAFMWAERRIGAGVVEPTVRGVSASLLETAKAYFSTGRGTGVDLLDSSATNVALDWFSAGAIP
jgi:hypothetical protein